MSDKTQNAEPLVNLYTIKDELTFAGLQAKVAVWGKKNFPTQTPQQCAMGVVEEVGELFHSLLKKSQGIRGSDAEHDNNTKDAVADIIVFLAHFCATSKWDLQEIVEKTWTQVEKRDWTKNKVDGVNG